MKVVWVIILLILLFLSIVMFRSLELLRVGREAEIYGVTYLSFGFKILRGSDGIFRFLVYSEENPSCRLVFRGYGEDFNFFSSVKNHSVRVYNEGFLFKVNSRKEGFWSTDVLINVSKLPTELIILDFLADLTLYGGTYTASEMFALEGSNCRIAYSKNVAQPQWPYVITIYDGYREIMKLLLIELSGSEGVYAGRPIKFIFGEKYFGLRFTVDRAIGLYKLRFRLYIWNPKCSNCIFDALALEAYFCKSFLNTSENLLFVKKIFESLMNPKSETDVFLIGVPPTKLYKAYVHDVRMSFTDAEMITQVNLLLGAAYVHSKLGLKEAVELIRFILNNSDNFNVFWDERVGVYSNNVGAAGRMDSWYQATNVVMLIEAHQLVPDIIPIDIQKLMRHADFLMRLAHKTEYQFPVFVWSDMRIEHLGVEADVALGYSYFMYLMYNLTKNRIYLEEAIRSLDTYMNKSFGKIYESHLTAMGIAASAALYGETGEERFKDYAEGLLYQALSWMQFIRGDIVVEEVPYTLVAAMPHIYHAAFEYGLFKYFLEKAYNISKGTPLEDSIRNLYKFYLYCGAITAKYSFPQYLGIKAAQVASGGTIDPWYWIPIEDVYPLRAFRSATLPQEIYGAGSHAMMFVIYE